MLMVLSVRSFHTHASNIVQQCDTSIVCISGDSHCAICDYVFSTFETSTELACTYVPEFSELEFIPAVCVVLAAPIFDLVARGPPAMGTTYGLA